MQQICRIGMIAAEPVQPPQHSGRAHVDTRAQARAVIVQVVRVLRPEARRATT